MRLRSATVLILGFLLAAPASGGTVPAECTDADQACETGQLEAAAAGGDIAAQIGLAQTLLQENENPANVQRAVALLQQASATGDGWSASILAGLYLEGELVPADGHRVLGLLVPLAADGSEGALSGLGDLFAKGAGAIEPDLPRAVRYYTRAADKGDAHGKYQLAQLLLEGKGIAADVPRAIALLDDLSAGGDPWILIQLGDLYASDKAGPAARALEYFNKAAAIGNSAAMVRLAQIYQTGLGTVAADAGRSFELLEQAASLGDVAGQVLLAQALLAQDDQKATLRAVALLKLGADKGEVWPATILANLYAQGEQVPIDGPAAVALLRPFADQGVTAALVGLGDVYFKGAGTVPSDLIQARGLFERAAKADNLSALNRLGFMLINGQGGEANSARGLKLLAPVVASGDTWAILQLADLYADGVVLPRDAGEAIRYYEQAAELGNVVGLSRLGAVYRTGLAEVAASRASAMAYFEQAASEGDNTGRIYLAQMLMEIGPDQDIDQAVTLLDAAAGTGDAWATAILADLLIRGDQVRADGARALALLEPLAAKNNAAALANMGNLYLLGAGTIAADPTKAAAFFEKAATLGDFGAKSRLGMMLVKGQGTPVDPDRGLALLREVAALGDGWSKIQLGDVLLSGENLPIDAEGALAAYQAARASGLTAGDIKIGNLYLSGSGVVAADPSQAANYFADAADKGESVGRINLALLLLNGNGVEQNVDRGVDLLKLAAETGDAWANGTLGGLYADGRHLTPDYGQAVQYSSAAQTAGDQGAMLRLGVLLAVGPLRDEHRDQGLELVEAAVTAMVPNAQVERARLQMMGLYGNKGGLLAEESLVAEVEDGNPAALRLLLQLYRSGGNGVAASTKHAKILLDEHASLLSPDAVAFETVALLAMPPATGQSLGAIGAAFSGIASPDVSQTVQLLFWTNQNAYVYVLQQRLQDAGIYAGPINGKLTRSTISAINQVCRRDGDERTCAQGPLTSGVAAIMGAFLARLPHRSEEQQA